MRGLLWWFWWGAGGSAGPASGGVFRRDGRLWARVIRWRQYLSTTLPRDTLTKTPREARNFIFDFSRAPEVVAGETLSSPTVYADAGVTVGTPTVTTDVIGDIPVGEAVEVLVSGGSAGDSYDLSCTVVTSGGATLEAAGRLVVADPGT